MTGQPFIPERITVHLGAPDENAENITVSFPEYVKNVASSEIYPTWPENSLRANIYAIITFALNRIYTEWYRLKGYDFDITSVTQYDQKFIKNREIFENISQLSDELFNNYVRRQGSVEPLFTQFCNGTTVTCDGLSQWGTVGLAKQGYTPYEILQYYYGDDIDIITEAAVMTNTPSYPGVELRMGTFGNDVRTIQVQLNRISRNYPAIPKISSVDGAFGVETENAVKEFQKVFGLPQTGVVNEATWYKIAYIYVSVKRLAELNSEGVRLEDVQKQFEEDLVPGMQNAQVRNLQYFLAVIGAYYEAVMPVEITGYYGPETENSVKSFQKVFGLPETGTVNRSVWLDIYRAYLGIVESVPIDSDDDVILFQGRILKEGMSGEDVRRLQEYLSFINKSYPNIPAVNNTGQFGPMTRASVLAFQRQFGLTQNGLVGAATWDAIAGLYSDLKYGFDKQPYQHPGYTIKEA
ncbi:MAG: peptidoglycan-binding protein [Oscillospiraceae bacterium]|nr:peptidoglycan-binding protein [Oscillospiraceae bacterium]